MSCGQGTSFDVRRTYPLLRLAAYTGMRRSELLGLKWSDVDLGGGTIAVRRTRPKVGVRDGGTGRDEVTIERQDGELVHADNVAQRFERLPRDAPDVPAIRFYDLRHTHASLLPPPVSRAGRVPRIGPSSAAVTLSVYAHVVPGHGRKAANTFADLLGDQGDGQR